MASLWWTVILVVTTTSGGKSSPCPQTARECSECIKAGPQCAWCSDETYWYSRCGERLQLEKSGCNNASIDSPPIMHYVATKAKPLTPTRLVQPQKAMLRLRKGARITIPVVVRAARPSVAVRLRYPKQLKVKVTSSCHRFKWKRRVANCGKVKLGEVVFNVTIIMKSCLSRMKKVKLVPDGQTKSTLKISVNSACNCECEGPEQIEIFSPRCSQRGNFSCGLCVCEAGRSGRYCECQESADDLRTCRPPNKKELCSNQGNCVCGFCECFERRYSGAYCECDEESCERHDGKICGGHERGHCMCGRCKCKRGYLGNACEKIANTTTCLSSNGALCSNHGKCVNGKCVCDSFYTGKTCNLKNNTLQSPLIAKKKKKKVKKVCQKTKACVQCYTFRTGPYDANQCVKRCSRFKFEFLDQIYNTSEKKRRGTQCIFKDEDGCFFNYSYMRNKKENIIQARRTKMCPKL